MQRPELLTEIVTAEEAFDTTVTQAKTITTTFKASALELVAALPLSAESKTVSAESKTVLEGNIDEIETNSLDVAAQYSKRKEELFLAGLYKKYQSQGESLAEYFTPTESETAIYLTSTDMLGSIGGSTKQISDTFIPSFIEDVHKAILESVLKDFNLESKGSLGADLTAEQQESNLEKFKSKLKEKGLDEKQAENLNKMFTELERLYKKRTTAASEYIEKATLFSKMLK